MQFAYETGKEEVRGRRRKREVGGEVETDPCSESELSRLKSDAIKKRQNAARKVMWAEGTRQAEEGRGQSTYDVPTGQ